MVKRKGARNIVWKANRIKLQLVQLDKNNGEGDVQVRGCQIEQPTCC